MFKKTIIGIIGPNKDSCTDDIYDFGISLGKYLIDKEFFIVCGGKEGLMEAVCKGAHRSEKYTFGCTIGILPENCKSEANDFVDIIIPSGIGISRNSIIINTSDLIIAVGGGAGTLSELAFAWQRNLNVFCNTKYGGWSEKLASTDIDKKRSGLLIPFKTLKDLDNLIVNKL